MRRIVLALLGAVLGTTLLIGLKSPMAGPVGLAASAPADPHGDAEPAQATTTPGTKAVPGPGGAATTVPATTAARGATTAPGGAPATTKPPTTAPKTTGPPTTTRTIVGTAYPATWQGDNYGNMQVQISVTGTHIDSVTTIQQSNRPRTVARDLGAKAVSLQSANVGNVSGATASSNAYKQSLQSAIAKI